MIANPASSTSQDPDPEPSPEPSPEPEPESWSDDFDDSQQSKGFFGRLMDAFSANEDDSSENGVTSTNGPLPQAAPGMVNLRRMRVDDVAIPKVEIVAAPVTVTLPELVEMFRSHGFSRIPIFRGTLDSPLGMLHLKDLALKHGFGEQANIKFALRPMLRPMLYVPPSMPIGVLLQQMQQQRTHMALVIDEYGGVDGLVTIEDLIEQVIGQIEDEHDEVEGGLWIAEKPGQWLIQARAHLDEVEQETGLRLVPEEDDDDVDSLGGLIFMMVGRVPVRGEVIPHESGAEFEIVEADARRIKRVRLRLTSTPRT